jgi:F-type H+-transporting ATPase subunit gamma
MAGAKEIRTKIKSIQSTSKITKAMQMVAASKMRKAQDRMASSRPYAEKMRQVMSHLYQANPEYRHPYLVERDIKRIGVILITTDRGLCGGLNINLFKTTVLQMKQWSEAGHEIDMAIFGSKGNQFFKRLGANVIAQATQLGDTPALTDLIGTVKAMLDAYDDGRVDRLYLGYNEFVNTMTQKPVLEQVIPIPPAEQEDLEHHWDYIYEPEAKSVIDGLLMRYIESLVYQGVVENLASEMAARMVAMKAASDNASNLIDELQLVYNKARQAAITQELSEIVSGAAAV